MSRLNHVFEMKVNPSQKYIKTAIFKGIYLPSLIILFLVSCASAPRMVHYSNYYISKDKVLNEVRTGLQSLDYEIDMYAPETYALSTKPVKIKGEASKYNYTLFVKISDRIEIYISAKIIIYKRPSKSIKHWNWVFIKKKIN